MSRDADNLNGLWKLGFGAIDPITLLSWNLPYQGLIANTLVANLPQVYIEAFLKMEKKYAYIILPVDSLLCILLIQRHLHLHAFS